MGPILLLGAVYLSDISANEYHSAKLFRQNINISLIRKTLNIKEKIIVENPSKTIK